MKNTSVFAYKQLQQYLPIAAKNAGVNNFPSKFYLIDIKCALISISIDTFFLLLCSS